MTDSATKAMGSLADLLLDYVDSRRAHGSSYDIAQCLLRIYPQLPSMSLRQMADACYVSKASFSRFCRYLGFDTFAEFKEAVDGARYRVTDDYTRQFSTALAQDQDAAFDTYRAKVADVVGTALASDDRAVFGEVIDALEGAGRIAYFSHHFLWHIGRYLQGKMLLMGKYIEMHQAYAHQEELAASLNEGDLAIICSLNGSFLSNYDVLTERIMRSGATTVVLTQNRQSQFINRADYVLMCGASNSDDIGKYAALMTADLMVMAYLRRIQTGEDSHEL